MGSWTTNQNFYKPDDLEDGWGDEKRTDWDTLDSMLKGFTKDGNTLDTNRLMGNGVASATHIASTESVTIPADHSSVVVGPMDVDGTLTVNGRLKVIE